jgi:3-phenylpropionate/trans-cinnamate dioxygenase subunit alpha
VPNFKEAYHNKLNRERWGLVPVAQFDNYKGLFFATFDPEAPPLREYLGEMSWYIDTFVDRREGGIEIVATHKWVMPCNWKFPAENFGGDAYHVHWSHGAAIATGFSVGSTASPAGANRMVSPGNGHVLICIGPDGFGDAPMPAIQAYERDIRPEVNRRLGPRAALTNPIVGTVFPNFSMLRGTSRTMRVWHPRGPEKTEIWSWVFVDKAAPPDVREAFRLSGVRGFSPVGNLRAGRYGQLAGMHPDLPWCRGTAHADQQSDGAWARALRYRPGCLGQRFRLQRKQLSAVLRALGRADEGR